MRLPGVAWLLLPLGCDGGELPGDPVGTFRVTARLDENGCGPSARAAQSASFDVEIRREGATGWWIPKGQPPVPGALDDAGVFLFQIAGLIAVREEVPSEGLAACTMDRIDEVRGTVVAPSDPDGGTPIEGRLDAEETLSFGATSESDCSDRIGLGEDQFLTLPCQIRYGIAGDALPTPE